jgi:hypothetical protein
VVTAEGEAVEGEAAEGVAEAAEAIRISASKAQNSTITSARAVLRRVAVQVSRLGPTKTDGPPARASVRVPLPWR